VIKADGSTELRKFRHAPAAPGDSRVAAAEAVAAAVTKIGARHSKADKERIKQAHDALVGLDPDCCPGAGVPGANVHARPKFSPQAGEGAAAADEDDQDETTEKLAKIFDRSVERTLAKALHGITARLDDVAARVKKIESQPLPLGATSVRVVDKAEDTSFPRQPESLLDRPGALEALAEAAIRKAQARPMRAIPGFRGRQE